MLSATSLFLAFAALSSPVEATPSKLAQEIALHARKSYAAEAVRTLADLVRFDTYHREGTSNAEHPSFRAMTAYLEAKARELGLDFVDHGAVVVLGLGQGEERLGVVTHGDVQPADGNKWARSPFELDTESEPGRLVGRGTEDDKGPIVCALYAMRAIADRGLELGRRIELIISYTEERIATLPDTPTLGEQIESEHVAGLIKRGQVIGTVTVEIADHRDAAQ